MSPLQYEQQRDIPYGADRCFFTSLVYYYVYVYVYARVCIVSILSRTEPSSEKREVMEFEICFLRLPKSFFRLISYKEGKLIY
jgi:hypothetical protein